ncbi:MAG: hypothetical protein RJA51_1490, partial [Actinomycetota bacterium]
SMPSMRIEKSPSWRQQRSSPPPGTLAVPTSSLGITGARYENGSALNMASHVEIDDVIDPADTRGHILAVIGSPRSWRDRTGKKRPMVDTW